MPDFSHTCLVADIGGTHGRFAIYDRGHLHQIKHYTCSDFATLADLVAGYCQDLDTDLPQQAVFAVATYVNSDTIEFTNSHLRFSVNAIAQQFQFNSLKVINDFTAVSLALPELTREQLIPIGGQQPPPRAAKAVLGAGTGLGVSGLLPHQHFWLPVQGQGGHVMVAANNKFEQTVLDFIYQHQGYISAENLLSGNGLVLLYQAITGVEDSANRNYSAADITRMGISQEDNHCHQVLQVFASMLGAVAGDLALTLGARGGVYLGGGVVYHLRDFLVNNPVLRNRFEQKGAMTDYLKAIPLYLVTEKNIGLIGAGVAGKAEYAEIGVDNMSM